MTLNTQCKPGIFILKQWHVLSPVSTESLCSQGFSQEHSMCSSGTSVPPGAVLGGAMPPHPQLEGFSFIFMLSFPL